MYRLYLAVKDRIEKYLTARSSLVANASAGDDHVFVANGTYFDFEGLYSKIPYVILSDANSTGERIDGGFRGMELIKVDNVNYNNGEIKFKTNLQNSWTTANSAYVQRAPGEVPVNNVVIGDIEVVKQFPCICIVPVNKTMDWFTMPGGTRETITIDFMIYITDENSEESTLDMLRLTDVVEWILMSNLHIQVADADTIYEVTSVALAKNIDYGVIQKGSTFLKSSKITWVADLYVMRDYLAGREFAPYNGQ
jgi:hypothetical protein